jgi:Na+-driven multidrug efflux pump
MSQIVEAESKFTRMYKVVKQSLDGAEFDYTQGSIKKAVILLAIPMILEMVMESVFALVDLYFVGHLENSSHAIQTVGLTESVLSIIYSLAVGMSMAATAVVARRIGEKNPEMAAKLACRPYLWAVLSMFSLGFWVSFTRPTFCCSWAHLHKQPHKEWRLPRL